MTLGRMNLEFVTIDGRRIRYVAFLSKILDRFGLANPHYVGPDVGTPIAVRSMADNPGRLRSAVIGDAGVVGHVEGPLMFRLLVNSRLVRLLTLSLGGAIGANRRSVAETGPGAATVTMTARFGARGPAHLLSPLVARLLARSGENVLDDVRTFLETGRPSPAEQKTAETFARRDHRSNPAVQR